MYVKLWSVGGKKVGFKGKKSSVFIYLDPGISVLFKREGAGIWRVELYSGVSGSQVRHSAVQNQLQTWQKAAAAQNQTYKMFNGKNKKGK